MKVKSLLILVVFLMPLGASAGAKEENKVSSAIEVLQQISAIPEKAVPPALLAQAYGVAVIPNVIKVGLGIGGRRGKGVLVVRDARGDWSDPTFVALTGGSFGFQIGAEATDVILVFKSRKGVEGITNGKLTLGADASVAAGPVGRSAAAATDITFKSEVYSYSRSRGLFAGVALDGSALTIDKNSNGAFYDVIGITAEQIFAGYAPRVPGIARRFTQELAQRTPQLRPEQVLGRSAQAVDAKPQAQPLKTYALEGPEATAQPASEL